MARVYQIRGAVGDTESTAIDPHFNHLVVACKVFTDDTYTTIATPTVGSIAIEGKVNGNDGWSALDLSPIDVTDSASYASTSIPLSDIRAVPTGIDVATHYQITITGNDH